MNNLLFKLLHGLKINEKTDRDDKQSPIWNITIFRRNGLPRTAADHRLGGYHRTNCVKELALQQARKNSNARRRQ
jgi:hypothetical protein